MGVSNQISAEQVREGIASPSQDQPPGLIYAQCDGLAIWSGVAGPDANTVGPCITGAYADRRKPLF